MEERLTAPGDELVAEVRSGVATVTLNRPAALNALSFGMLESLADWLRRWESDDRVRLVVLRGAGEKAFCAGGDVRALYGHLTSETKVHHQYFEVEYALDYHIHTYPKTIVAVMDGIVMGGGMGLAQGAKVRLVGSRTKMAMPETAIGLFPDVGGSYFLSRVPGQVGIYLGLIGPTITSADAIYCGLADVDVSPAPGTSALKLLRPAIDRHFGHDSVAAIIASLEAESDTELRGWTRTTLDALAKRSPTLLAVTLEQLRRGVRMSLADCLRMELNLIHACFEQGDIVEGIRALIVEKDNQPRWRPPHLADVTRASVDAFFAERWPRSTHPLASLGEART